MDDIALAFCYHHFVIQPNPDSNVSIHVKDTILLDSMKALGMAAYANFGRCKDLQEKAREYYIQAIQETNSILQSPDYLEDRALLAVLMLSFFEAVAGSSDNHSTSGWESHIRGLATLYELRGPKQVQTAEGRLLFMQAIANVTVSCFQVGARLPRSMHDVMRQAFQQLGVWRGPMCRLHSAYMRLCDLDSDSVQDTALDPHQLLDRALQLDNELAQIPTEGRLDGNSNAISGKACNAIYSGRMMCQLIVVSAINRLDSPGGLDLSREALRISA